MKKLLMVGALVLGIGALSGCSVIDSFSKSIESNTTGLARDIAVYSVTGELLAEYSGDIVRIESENENGKVSILNDGKRQSFYNATVIIEER